ncbi:NAD-dependent epimerase/dehydratase family protein [Veronia nyctiphanis]|nr:NAD-dependent epimerase/dehydratase family protein [Veronia nyctiphanis]
MKILILGGTGFIGSKLVEKCLLAKHSVTVFSRGETPNTLSGDIERIEGDRDIGLSELHGEWDVCIDLCGYTAKHVRDSASQFHKRVGHYIYISAVRAFQQPRVSKLQNKARFTNQ